MAEKRKRKAGVVREKMLGIRLDPKLHYLVNLAVRKQRRSILSFAEWAFEQVLKTVTLDDGSMKSVMDEAEDLWRVKESDRLVALATIHPALLTYDEQRKWAIVDTYRIPILDGKKKEWLTFKFKMTDSADNRHDLAVIGRCWDEITRYALEEEGKAELDAAMIRNHNDLYAENYTVAKK